MHIALRTRTPIVPVGVVGCEETIPSLGNFKALARLLQVPYVPLTLPFPLPARVTLNFGTPMVFEAQTFNETVMTELVEQVKARIQDLIQKGLFGIYERCRNLQLILGCGDKP